MYRLDKTEKELHEYNNRIYTLELQQLKRNLGNAIWGTLGGAIVMGGYLLAKALA